RRLAREPDRSASGIGRTGDTGVARREGLAAAHTLRAVGVNVNLAPVVDVARSGSQLEKEHRTFGSDAAQVALLGEAFARGLNDGGVAATFKHFPGLGSARTTTDYGPTTVDLPKAVLRRLDERPFADATHGARRLVMVSTATYSALAHAPAALSPAVVQTELRRILGFHGISVTDNLDSPALRGLGTPAQRAI